MLRGRNLTSGTSGRITGVELLFNDGEQSFVFDDFDAGIVQVANALDGNFNNIVRLVGGGADEFLGSQGDDMMRSYGGDDLIEGRGGSDLLTADGGNDIVIAGDGRDTIKAGGGDDVVRDFKVGKDKLDVSAASAIDDFADLIANHASDVGDDLVIAISGSSEVTLENLSTADLSEIDFIF